MIINYYYYQSKLCPASYASPIIQQIKYKEKMIIDDEELYTNNLNTYYVQKYIKNQVNYILIFKICLSPVQISY
jgi:hypothetical protein